MRVKPNPQMEDLFWDFIAERHKIYWKKVMNLDPPWTDFEPLARVKFTNVYRVLDKESQNQQLQCFVFSNDSYANRIARVFIYQAFNKLETWQFAKNCFYDKTWYKVIHWDPPALRYVIDCIQQRMADGHVVFSAAYHPTNEPFDRLRYFIDHY